jgi:uncharacterized membrane protein YesL
MNTNMPIFDPFRLIWKALKVWWEGWFSVLLFGFVWLLCWVTVILGPPATFGFFHAVRWWMVEKETKWDQFYRMGKKHFVTSWLWFLANLLVFFLVFANYVFYGSLESDISRLLQFLALVVGSLWLAVQLYALPYFVLLEKKSLTIAWKNGLFTILASPVFSLVVFAAIAAVGYLHLTLMPLLFGGPGLIVMLASIAVEDRIQKFGIRERDANAPSESPVSDSTPPDLAG